MHLYLQVAALLYLGLIAIIYFRKKSLNTIENISFRTSLIYSLLIIIMDIVNAEYNIWLANGEYSEILFKMYLWTVISYVFTFTFYVYSVTSKYSIGLMDFKYHPNRKQFKKVSNICMVIIAIVCAIVTIIPIKITPDGNIYYREGPGMIVAYVASLIGVLSWVVMLIKNRKNNKTKKIIPIIFFSTTGIITIVLQIIFPTFPLVTAISAFATAVTFFTLENPDAVLIGKLTEARGEADAANQAKTDFLSSMSHEIRTPLNAIVGFGQALAKEDISGTAKEEVKDILMASNTLLDIVNGILDISKIEANKIELVNGEYQTRKMIAEVTSLINARIGSKALDFKIIIDENLPDVLYGDAMRIKQMIINLLTNAVKYTDEGRILFQVKAENTGDISKLTISVQDTGMGMTQEAIDQLFTKYQRFDMNKNINVEGTGLGMAITKGLVDLMNGEIQVKSTYGQGSTFTIIIDQKIIKQKLEESEKEATSENIKAFDASGQTVLVVDDNKINLKVAERLLREYKLTVEMVGSGSDCIDRVLDGKKYDLIFMDIMMPKMNGIEALENLKNIVGFKMPVVALTADVISGMEEKYISKGFDDCLAKPIVEEELYHMLKKFLKEKEPSSTPEVTTEDLQSNEAHNIDLLECNRINVKAGLELLKDMEMYDMTLEEFYNELLGKISDLKAFKEDGNMDDYAILAHGLKSEARYVGCNELGDIAYEHELAGKEKNQELVNQKFEELETEANRVYEVIKKYLGE